MVIVQIKGSNGAGKSTIPLQMLERSQDVRYTPVDGSAVGKLTILEDLGWVLVGHYRLDASSPTSNGCDNIGKVDGVKQAILDAMIARPHFNILFEGMMISTIKSTFYQFRLDLEARTPTVEPMFVILRATTKGCLDRLSARGTRKTGLKVDNIRSKCTMVIRHAETYDQKYVRWIHVEEIPKEQMLDEFLRVTGLQAGGYLSYMDVVRMDTEDVKDALVLDHSYATHDVDEMDHLQLRRALIMEQVEPLYTVREATSMHYRPALAPWHTAGLGPEYARMAGYQTGSGSLMTLLVQLWEVPRGDVPLLTDYEQVILCGDCKGAGGSCPKMQKGGQGPRGALPILSCEWPTAGYSVSSPKSSGCLTP